MKENNVVVERLKNNSRSACRPLLFNSNRQDLYRGILSGILFFPTNKEQLEVI